MRTDFCVWLDHSTLITDPRKMNIFPTFAPHSTISNNFVGDLFRNRYFSYHFISPIFLLEDQQYNKH